MRQRWDSVGKTVCKHSIHACGMASQALACDAINLVHCCLTGTWCMTRQTLHINSVHRAFPKCIQQSYSLKRWALSKVDSTTRLVGDAGCMGQTPTVVYTATYILSVVETLCSLAADTITSSLHTFYPRGCAILHSFIQGGVLSCPLLSNGVCYRALFYVRGGVILHSFIHGGCLIFLHSFIRGGV